MTTIRGTALAPGRSLNNRWYSAEAISSMVKRGQKRIRKGERPIVMFTHHNAEDSTKIAGHLTSLNLAPDGSAQFEAQLTDTAAGRDIASLVSGGALRGVSIAGEWRGPVRQALAPDGQLAELGSDLELHSVDFTPSPGVPAAMVRATESRKGGRLIFEEAPQPVSPAAGLTVADLAKMPHDEFTELAEAHLALPHAALITARHQSPFMRGLGDPGLDDIP